MNVNDGADEAIVKSAENVSKERMRMSLLRKGEFPRLSRKISGASGARAIAAVPSRASNQSFAHGY